MLDKPRRLLVESHQFVPGSCFTAVAIGMHRCRLRTSPMKQLHSGFACVTLDGRLMQNQITKTTHYTSSREIFREIGIGDDTSL